MLTKDDVNTIAKRAKKAADRADAAAGDCHISLNLVEDAAHKAAKLVQQAKACADVAKSAATTANSALIRIQGRPMKAMKPNAMKAMKVETVKPVKPKSKAMKAMTVRKAIEAMKA